MQEETDVADLMAPGGIEETRENDVTYVLILCSDSVSNIQARGCIVG
jgi:hypothetical protein